MIEFDEKAFYWQTNPAWYTETEAEDGGPEYTLKDDAPQEAKDSFERFKLFSQVTCEDAFDPSPAAKEYFKILENEDKGN